MIRSVVAGLGLVLCLTSCMQQSEVASAGDDTTPQATDEPRTVQSDFFRPSTLGDTRIKGVRFVGKTVSDIDDTIAFYQQAVPYELVHRYRIPASEIYLPGMMDRKHGEVEIALIKTPTVFLQLTDFDPDAKEPPFVKPVYGPGYTHVCFQSPASDQAFSKFKQAGLDIVTIGGELVDIGGYGIVYAYGRDHDGTMIENEVMDRPTRQEKAWISHIGGATSDVDRMIAFYTKFIGYGARRTGEYSGNKKIDAIAGIDGLVLRSSWFVVRNLQLEFWQYVTPPTPVRDAPAMVDQMGYNMTAFEVTDADAERKRLAAEGIKMMGPAIMSRGWKIYYAHDPDGNIISIQQNMSAGKDESIDAMLWIDPTTY
ncbi:VOC family protein [Parasphingorhabdus cellanae]|uniref:VOC family protein n=1 Tax=Parasphingorhabdus cellanae TaxID=2806553 RepID=A0ABX7T928_9SPHN|nr:VOC family protein [Parasphingorhabdus cellanae]QTD57455.1 VOC family protein [Parasphingorhabdus cellanae]